MYLMDPDDIDSAVKKIVEEIDYDIYKELYVYPFDPEEARESIDRLEGILRHYLTPIDNEGNED